MKIIFNFAILCNIQKASEEQ